MCLSIFTQRDASVPSTLCITFNVFSFTSLWRPGWLYSSALVLNEPGSRPSPQRQGLLSLWLMAGALQRPSISHSVVQVALSAVSWIHSTSVATMKSDARKQKDPRLFLLFFLTSGWLWWPWEPLLGITCKCYQAISVDQLTEPCKAHFLNISYIFIADLYQISCYCEKSI